MEPDLQNQFERLEGVVQEHTAKGILAHIHEQVEGMADELQRVKSQLRTAENLVEHHKERQTELEQHAGQLSPSQREDLVELGRSLRQIMDNAERHKLASDMPPLGKNAIQAIQDALEPLIRRMKNSFGIRDREVR